MRRLAIGLLGAVLGLVLVAPTRAAAQPAPPPGGHVQPRPSPSVDRSVMPFSPLQAAWMAPMGLEPSAPPATDGVRLYVPITRGDFNIFSMATGAFLTAWPYPTRLAPVIAEHLVLITGDRLIDAVRGADSAPQWRTPLAAPAAYAPVVRSGWAFVALADGGLTALRTDTGKIVWTQALGSQTVAPVVEGDRIYAATEGGALQAVAVSDGAPLWRVALDGNINAVAAVEGYVFAATAGRWLYALDARRGSVRWRYRIGGTAIGLVVDEDRIVAVMLDQSVRAFKIGSGAQAWRAPLTFRPAAGPVVTGASILVTGYGPNLRMLNRRTGRNEGLYAIPLPFPATPSGISLETLAAGPIVWHAPSPFDDLVVLVTRSGWIHAARRGFDQPVSPITVLPGVPLPAPQPPAGWTPPPAPPPGASTPATPADAAPSPATAAPAAPPTASKPPA